MRWSPEWRPELPLWPSQKALKVGGFDLALRFDGDVSFSLVAELKWTHHGFVNALDEAIWDAMKLAHAVESVDGVRRGLHLPRPGQGVGPAGALRESVR